MAPVDGVGLVGPLPDCSGEALPGFVADGWAEGPVAGTAQTHKILAHPASNCVFSLDKKRTHSRGSMS